MTSQPAMAGQSGSERAGITIAIASRIGGSTARPGDRGFSLDLKLQLPGQGVTAIFGASGSGKTSLLRCIAGLQSIDRGLVQINNETWHDDSSQVPTHMRGVGFVFQEASLFEHLTANGNLQYAIRRAPGVPDEAAFNQIVELMGIATLLDRLPEQMSGGERQRVAIARALLARPRLLLMDEPLAALDHQRRQEILPYLERLHREIALPILYVTHSLEEVTRLADHLVVLEQGRVQAQGEVVELLSRADLNLGSGVETGSMLSGEIVERDARWHLARVRFDGGELWVRDRDQDPGAVDCHDEVRLRILARDISLALEDARGSSILNRLPATVAEISDAQDPALATVQLRLGDSRLLARVSRRSVAELDIHPGQQLWAQIKSVAILR